MKLTAALLALTAPVATAANIVPPPPVCTGASPLILGNLTFASSIKRTSVMDGQRIVETMTVENNNAAATSVYVTAPYPDTANTLIRGSAKAPGRKAVALKKTTLVVNAASSIPNGELHPGRRT